jgi:hypothetical protein
VAKSQNQTQGKNPMSVATSFTPAKIRSALNTIFALADAIRELREVPEGHLYARVMTHLSLDEFDAAMRVLKNNKMIKIEHRMITWIGPEKSTI